MLNPIASRPAVEEPPKRKPLTKRQKLEVWTRESGECWWCEEPVALEEACFDHHVPRALKGGPDCDALAGQYPMHKRCHGEKTRGEDRPRIDKMKRQKTMTEPKKASRMRSAGGFPKGRKLQSQGFRKGGPKQKIQSQGFRR